MVVLGDKILCLGLAPIGVVTLKERSLPDGERGHAKSRHTEVVRAVIVACARRRIRLQLKEKCSRSFFCGGIKRRSLSACYFRRQGNAERHKHVKVQV